MTIERYNTPNHPRWNSKTKDAPTDTTGPRPRYGRLPPRRDGCRTEGIARSGPSLLQSRDVTEDDTTIELSDTSDWTCITTELSDRSLEDVHVSVSGASVRIRAEPSDTASGMDRTITLAHSINAADMVIAYDDPVLTVIVPNEN